MTESIPQGEAYWYLATPYSKYPGGLENAFLEACRVMAILIRQGFRVYSPIVHSHPIAINGGIDPLDHGIWLPADAPFMHAASGLIVVKMLGWEISYGIGEEIKIFTAAEKPILYMEWEQSYEITKAKATRRASQNRQGISKARADGVGTRN